MRVMATGFRSVFLAMFITFQLWWPVQAYAIAVPLITMAATTGNFLFGSMVRQALTGVAIGGVSAMLFDGSLLEKPDGWADANTPPGSFPMGAYESSLVVCKAILAEPANLYKNFVSMYQDPNRSDYYICVGAYPATGQTNKFLVRKVYGTSCSAGYTYSAGMCNLTDASLVVKPPDGVCSISWRNWSSTPDSRDPDCKAGVAEYTRNGCKISVGPVTRLFCGVSEVFELTREKLVYKATNGVVVTAPVQGQDEKGNPIIGPTPPTDMPSHDVPKSAGGSTSTTNASGVTTTTPDAGMTSTDRGLLNLLEGVRSMSETITQSVTNAGAAVVGAVGAVGALPGQMQATLDRALAVDTVSNDLPEVKKEQVPEMPKAPSLDVDFLEDILPPVYCTDFKPAVQMPILGAVDIPIPVCDYAQKLRPMIGYLWYAMTAIGMASTVINLVPREEKSS